MTFAKWGAICATAVALAAGSVAVPLAQETVAPVKSAAPAQDAKALVPLKVTVLISRMVGDKKTASLPFTLWVNANDVRHGTSLRMSESVPVPGGSNSYNYRNIGTNIDVSAQTIEDGRFSVVLTIEDSQVFSDAAKLGVNTTGLPSFQSFTSSMNVLLRDGQTVQYTTATDKITGEVVRVDVTVNVLK